MPKFNKNKRFVPKERPVPVQATATFNSFEDAIDTLREIDIIDNFFNEISISNDRAEYDQYLEYIAKKAATDFPQLIAKHNIHSTFTITPNRVLVRTEDNISFSWDVVYTVENRVATITEVKVSVVLYDTFESIKTLLSDNGFELKEKVRRKPQDTAEEK